MEKISLMDYFSTGDTMSDSPILVQSLFDKLRLIHSSNRKADIIDENNILVNPDDITDNRIESSDIPSYEDKDEVVKKDLISLYCLSYGLYIYEYYHDMNAQSIIKNQEVLRENFDRYSMVLPSEDIVEYRNAIVDGNPNYLSKDNSRFVSSNSKTYSISNGHPTGIVGNEDISNIKAYAATLFMAMSLTVIVALMTILAFFLAK